MDTILTHEIEKLRRKLKVSDDPHSVLKTLGQKNPIQILADMFEACQTYFTGFQRMKVGNFLQFITEDSVMRGLFLRALYEGAYNISGERLLSASEEEHGIQQQGGTVEQVFYHEPPGKPLFGH